MERKLASVQIVDSVSSIPGADRIEVVRVLGWEVVTKKGEFEAGDPCVYFEVDSFLPESPEFEFLRSSSYRELHGKGGFRLRTVKLRGQLSQGLVVPYSGSAPVGTDMTQDLGVEKWDPPLPACLAGEAKGLFPGFLSKTDEIRVQSEPSVLTRLTGRPYYITTKLDGSSTTFYAYDGEFGVCSRNLEFLESQENSLWQIARDYDLENKLLELGNICIQGEICGPGIQKNPLRLKHIDFFVFNAYRIQPREFLSWDEMSKLAEELGLKTVPLEEVGADFGYSLDALLSKADGNYDSGVQKEGIVIRSQDRGPGSVSFKVLSNEFLLTEE